MWKEAKQAGLRSLALDPQNIDGMRDVLLSRLNGTGDIKEATRILGTFPSDITFATASWSLQEIIRLRASVYLARRDFGAALQAWDKESSDPTANRQRLSAESPFMFWRAMRLACGRKSRRRMAWSRRNWASDRMIRMR